MFPEHQRSIVGTKKKRKEREKKTEKEKTRKPKKQGSMKSKKGDEFGDLDSDLKDLDWDDSILNMRDDQDDDMETNSPLSGTARKSRKKSLLAKTPEVMAARRRKVWQLMAKKELGKVQRAKANNHKEMLQSCKRVSTMCMKVRLIFNLDCSKHCYSLLFE